MAFEPLAEFKRLPQAASERLRNCGRSAVDLFLKPGKIVKPLDDYKRFPKMVHWFNPVLLRKLLNNVVTSAMFGQYADRRLIVAALDTVSPDELEKRARALRKTVLSPGQPVWFDFVADLGDGFDSTYAVASLLGQPTLKVGDEEMPRGKFLLMGGDEVYPLASQQAYRYQLKQPYKWASPDPAPKSDDGVPLFAIPGNHDWYDGLVLFLAHFCREKPSHFGSWRSAQRRSYFAIQLTDKWWLWAIDIQLADDMDQPQADYFVNIAKIMDPDSRIILCSAEPGWLYTDTNAASWSITDFATGLARDAGKKFTIPILLSGDTHHYSRYEAADGTQFVTSGGGGAFLHPTHQLEDNVDLLWAATKRPLALAKKAKTQEPAVYPSMAESKKLIWGNTLFALTNWDFSILMAVIYTIIGLIVSLRDEPDVYAIVALIVASALVAYTTDQEKVSLLKSWKEAGDAAANPLKDAKNQQDNLNKIKVRLRKTKIVYVASLAHAAAHALVALAAAHYFFVVNARWLIPQDDWLDVWKWIGVTLFEMGTTGFFVGSTIFGLNMLITGLWLRMSRNDSFSALRIGRFNNFLRIRIDGDTAEVNVIGLENVPARADWMDNPKMRDPDQPHFIPVAGKELRPHLVEKFVVKGSVTPA